MGQSTEEKEKKDRHRVAGFTLLELIVVMLLAAVMAGIAGVYLVQRMPAHSQRAAARDISSTLRQARTAAWTNWEEQEIVVDLDRGKYKAGRRMRAVPAGISLSVEDPVRGEITSGTYTFTVRPGGQMDGGAIILRGGRKTLRIAWDPLSGAEVREVE